MDAAFRDSTLELSSKLFTFLYTLIGIGFVTEIGVLFAVWKGERVTLSDNLGSYCASVSPVWAFIYLAFWDITISTLLCLLFVQRLFKAHLACKSMDDKTNNRWIRNIAKYVTLTVVGVCSTFIGLFIVAGTSWFSIAGIDSVINCWCVYLMYSQNGRLFVKICGKCHKCMGKCIYCCIQCKQGMEKSEFLAVYSRRETPVEMNESVKINETVRVSSASETHTATIQAEMEALC